jgi:hypothetical protein
MPDTRHDKPVCLYCQQDSDTIPLILLRYQDEDQWICPQHLPILIHNPALLAGILPGAEHFEEAEHHD